MTWTRCKNRLCKDKKERKKLEYDRLLFEFRLKYALDSLFPIALIILIAQSYNSVKDMDASPQCRVCTAQTEAKNRVQLKCQHIFCADCVKKYIEVLRNYHLLTPEKLCCLEEGCKQEIEDGVITKLFPGQLGFIFNIIKKRYRESKDPNMIIFDCQGYITLDRKPVLPKPTEIGKEPFWKSINEQIKKIINKEQSSEGVKTCKNILAFNKNVPRKQNCIQCNVCSCAYCISCFNFVHDGTCPEKSQADLAIIKGKGQSQGTTDEIDNFVERNGILRCLNPDCRVAIAKEQGCFWIKCRCSWEMCYPCQKLWGDCEHFKNYPYKKFVPPPKWMVKALNLY